ncbi:ASCH domain-containing protein, partial [Salmonella enterica]|nr:ASCH domain-containing protein [Salmonella enterica]
IRFNEMSADLAALEGEGDLSLAYWQAAHRAFFEREGNWSPEMELVYEEFAVLEIAP